MFLRIFFISNGVEEFLSVEITYESGEEDINLKTEKPLGHHKSLAGKISFEHLYSSLRNLVAEQDFKVLKALKVSFITLHKTAQLPIQIFDEKGSEIREIVVEIKNKDIILSPRSVSTA